MMTRSSSLKSVLTPWMMTWALEFLDSGSLIFKKEAEETPVVEATRAKIKEVESFIVQLGGGKTERAKRKVRVNCTEENRSWTSACLY